MPLRIVTEPTIDDDVVSLDEMKSYLKLDIASTDEDEIVISLIRSARDWVEKHTRRGVIEVPREYIVDTDGKLFVELPRPPLKEITKVFVTDFNGNESEIASSYYRIDKSVEPNMIFFKTGTGDYVRFLYTSGYAKENVPGTIKNAVMMIVAARYENRNTGEIPPSVMQMLSGHRIMML